MTSSTIEFGVTVITSQVTLRDSTTITPKSMVLMTLPGEQMDSRTHILTTMITTTGMIRVMASFATVVEVMDVSFAVDTDINTEMLLLENMVTPSRLASVMVTPTHTLEISQDHLTTSMDMVLEEDIPRDGPMDMEADTVSVTDTDMVLPTDGPPTMDMDTVTLAQRDP